MSQSFIFIVEKHFTISRGILSPDSTFSMEPDEFRVMVDKIRLVERALGEIKYEPSEAEIKSRIFRRSLFAVKDMKKGEAFTNDNLRSIRPGNGLAPRHLQDIIGCKASCDIARGTPLTWAHVAGKSN